MGLVALLALCCYASARLSEAQFHLATAKVLNSRGTGYALQLDDDEGAINSALAHACGPVRKGVSSSACGARVSPYRSEFRVFSMLNYARRLRLVSRSLLWMEPPASCASDDSHTPEHTGHVHAGSPVRWLWDVDSVVGASSRVGSAGAGRLGNPLADAATSPSFMTPCNSYRSSHSGQGHRLPANRSPVSSSLAVWTPLRRAVIEDRGASPPPSEPSNGTPPLSRPAVFSDDPMTLRLPTPEVLPAQSMPMNRRYSNWRAPDATDADAVDQRLLES